MITTLGILAILTYIATLVLIVVRLKQRLEHTDHRTHSWVKWVWGLSVLLQAAFLYIPVLQQHSLTLGMNASIQHVFWLLSLLLLITIFKRKVEVLGIFIIPFILLSLVVALINPDPIGYELPLSNSYGIHIFVSFLAYSLLALATAQAVLIAIQNKFLHNHHPGGFIRTLPALQNMESLLFRLIALGWLLLTIALVTGFVYMEGFFEQGVAHKTVLSIVAWFLFAGLLLGRWQYGWRGQIAVRWTLAGFIVLMLAYFGSRFVLDYLVS